ncbi:MAG TPA: hypothetical protein VNO22_14150 [Planctomycetota bacterium]|nr:hypothetical protein [Planctomycetota bacterium]
MDRTCLVCRRPTRQEDCYIRLEKELHPACRSCWEQLLLDPRRVLRSLSPPPGRPADSDRPRS